MVSSGHQFIFECLIHSRVHLRVFSCLLNLWCPLTVIKKTLVLLSAYCLQYLPCSGWMLWIRYSVGSMQEHIYCFQQGQAGSGPLCLLPHLGWQRWFWGLVAPWTSLRLTHYPGPQTQSHICNKVGDRSTKTDKHKGVTTLDDNKPTRRERKKEM